MKAQGGCRDSDLLFFLTSALNGGGWLTPCPGRFTPGKGTRYPIYGRLGGGSGPVWTGVENLVPYRDSIP